MPTSNLVLPLTAINHLPVDIRLVMFDMAGTTVNDTVDGMPLVTAAMIRAFKEVGIVIKEEAMTPHRGKSKRDAVQALLEAHLDQVPDLKQKQESASIYQQALSSHTSHIFSLFNKHLNTLLSSISSEIEGTTHVMRTLKSRGIKIGVGSGFSREVVEKIVENMGWKKHGLVDYIGSADSTPKGRPDPGMILQCMSVCGITDPRQVVKVGDTQVDVEEGHNAKTWTVAVLTGTQSQSTLTKSRPDFILSSIALLPAILTSPSQLSSHVTRARIISRKSLTRQSTGSLTRQPTPDVVNDIDTDMFPRLTTRRYVINDKIVSRL